MNEPDYIRLGNAFDVLVYSIGSRACQVTVDGTTILLTHKDAEALYHGLGHALREMRDSEQDDWLERCTEAAGGRA